MIYSKCMQIFLMEPHNVAFACHENEAVEMKNRTEGGANPPATSVSLNYGRRRGCFINQFLSLMQLTYMVGTIFFTHEYDMLGIACTQDVVESADACSNSLSLLTATWRLPTG